MRPFSKLSGRGGHPATYTSTGTNRSIPCTTGYERYIPPDEAQAPIAMTHLGSGIWSYIFLTTFAILYVTVPATIMTSHCRGEKRMTSEPKRAMSWRGSPADMSSIAQQEIPIGIGQREF